MVNRRARAVTPRILETLEALVGPRDLYVSQSLDSARGIARYLITQKYDVLLCAGGDGTFSRVVTDVYQALGSSAQSLARMPAFGVLRLGTGNSVANTLGASPRSPKGFAMDLWRARATQPAGKLSLLDVEGRLTPFAGFGLDAQILDDHEQVAQAMGRMGLGFLGTGNHSYAVSVTSLSIPRAVLSKRPEIIVRNLGAPAVRQGSARPHVVPTGAIIYRGRPALCAVSTVPYYGLGMRMFPFVDGQQDDHFQLRLWQGTPYMILSNLPSVWRGEYREEDALLDYRVTRVGFEVVDAEGDVLQVAGDLVGRRRQVEIGLAASPLRVVT
jgi:diacylglycerol kinase family enzyme